VAKKTKSKSDTSPESAAKDSFVILLDEPDPEPASEQAAAKNVDLRSDCTITEIAGIRSRLLNELEGSKEVTIDLGGIGNVDTAFLQTLCSLQSEADARDIRVNWREPTASFRASADLLGLGDYFKAS
jgi:ABC-type transporter Mla MlaB component